MTKSPWDFSLRLGTGPLNPATGPYAFGSTVQLTALPAAGSYFFGWAGATGGFANPLFLTATNPAGLTALFGSLNPHQVSLTVLPNGDGAVSGPGGSATSAPASVAWFGFEWALSSGQRVPLLTLDCAPGTSFRLEHSWDLSPTNWSLLAPVPLDGNRLYFVDTFDTNRFLRFYRAVPE